MLEYLEQENLKSWVKMLFPSAHNHHSLSARQRRSSPRAEHTSLILAARAGDRQECARLLRLGAEANATDSLGQTALHITCLRDTINVDVVNLLLKHGCLAGSRDYRGWSALHTTCSKGGSRVAVIWRLYEANRQTICEADNEGATPLLIAIRSANSSVMRTLIDLGAPVGVADKFGNTPISAALSRLQPRKDYEDVIIALSVLIAAKQQQYTSPEVTALRNQLDSLGYGTDSN